MDLNDGIQQLMQEDPLILLVGAALLMATPPLVGLSFWVTLFQGEVHNIGQFLRRVILGLFVGLATAVGLAWLGSILFQPSTAESFFALMFIIVFFGLLGSGWLDW